MAEINLAPTIADSETPAIRVRGLRTGFGDEIIHDGLDLDVRAGEIIGIVGGSGTGKSVLMRAIIGLQRHSAGSIEIFGQNVADLDDGGGRELRRRWGVLFQDGALFSSLTVAENIEVPMREFLDLPEAIMGELAGYKVAMAGLPGEAGPKFPSELSGGMRKRAGLARALALDPQLLFLDEPTAGLDPISATAFDELIKSLKDTLGLTVFLITHDLDTLYAICDRVAVIADRKVLAMGTIGELMTFDHPWVQSYFAGPRGRAAGQDGGRAADSSQRAV